MIGGYALLIKTIVFISLFYFLFDFLVSIKYSVQTFKANYEKNGAELALKACFAPQKYKYFKLVYIYELN